MNSFLDTVGIIFLALVGAVAAIWLAVSIAAAIREKKSIGITIGLLLLLVEEILFALYLILKDKSVLSPSLSKYAPIIIPIIGCLGVAAIICGGFRDLKRAGEEISPGMKKSLIGWGIFIAVDVLVIIGVFIGKKLSGT